MALVFVPNPRLTDQIAGYPGVERAVESQANDVLEHARAIAPRVTGHYASSFEVVHAGGDTYVVNNAEYAAAVEWGTRDIPHGQHILSRSADWVES